MPFLDWFKDVIPRGRPWLVFGKGPSFSRHKDFLDLESTYETMGLNHVCRERVVKVTHAIDLQAVEEVSRIDERTEWLVMPWHPHVHFMPSKETLEDLVQSTPALQRFERKGRLLWYNLVTGRPHREGSPIVPVAYFSVEAAISLLAIAGVKTIRTLGVDGGSRYAEEFSDIKPFRAGHSTFDHQRQHIDYAIKRWKLDLKPLSGAAS